MPLNDIHATLVLRIQEISGKMEMLLMMEEELILLDRKKLLADMDVQRKELTHIAEEIHKQMHKF